MWGSWVQVSPDWWGAVRLISAPALVLELGGLDLIHGSDTESLHDLRRSDTMVMNTAQMSRQIRLDRLWIWQIFVYHHCQCSPVIATQSSCFSGFLAQQGEERLIFCTEEGTPNHSTTMTSVDKLEIKQVVGQLLEEMLHGRRAHEWAFPWLCGSPDMALLSCSQLVSKVFRVVVTSSFCNGFHHNRALASEKKTNYQKWDFLKSFSGATVSFWHEGGCKMINSPGVSCGYFPTWFPGHSWTEEYSK